MSSEPAKTQGLLTPTLIAAAALGAGAFYLMGQTSWFNGTFTTAIGGSTFSGDTLRLMLSGLIAALPTLGGVLKDVLSTILVSLGINSKPQLDRVETVIADLKTSFKDGQLLVAEIAKTLGVKAAASGKAASGAASPPATSPAAADAGGAPAASSAKTVA